VVEEARARTSTTSQGAGEADAVAAGNAGRLPGCSADAAVTGIFVIENAASRPLLKR